MPPPVARWRLMPSGRMAQVWEHSSTPDDVEIDVSDFALCPRTRPTRELARDALAALIERSMAL